ncbi:dimethylarginine dimethylaminohydrolase family protein [Roseivirga sp. E12]|uniref:dimethylarginine dimethylaminohydrolase family protein n=1 Tax=Roseivirga sp. E12 TaxID=2819237 RepID=UPI001ABCA8A1|nr:arginine deiminase family protein [Roseivirga sp. E12]MBO3697637.1 amidinotransferase [Roseivirga sp. E12]
MKIQVSNETAPLEVVILGIANDMGAPLDINPVSKSHMLNGTYPVESDILNELATFEKALLEANVQVLRPRNLEGVEQIFTRDIGFAIDNKFVIANMREPVRQKEFPGIEQLLSDVPKSDVLRLPDDVLVEGGDVIVHNDYVFVGISRRTNMAGYEFLKNHFQDKSVHALPLEVTDSPQTNILHLDCAFQPVGEKSAIIYEEGFKSRPEVLYDLFDEDDFIRVSLEEKQRMFPNIFSVSPTKVIVEEQFHRLKEELASRGIETVDVKFKETSKLSGLLRCSTLPLRRSHTNM